MWKVKCVFTIKNMCDDIVSVEKKTIPHRRHMSNTKVCNAIREGGGHPKLHHFPHMSHQHHINFLQFFQFLFWMASSNFS